MSTGTIAHSGLVETGTTIGTTIGIWAAIGGVRAQQALKISH